MKSYVTLLILAVVGLVVPGTCAMKPKKSESLFTSGKVLGALGLGASAYYVYNHPDETKAKLQEAKTKLGEWKDLAVNKIKTADKSTLMWGAAGGIVALYLGYKWLNQATEPELAVESPDGDAFLKTLGTEKKTTVATQKSAPKVQQFDGWLRQAGDLIKQSFSHIKNEKERLDAMKPYIQTAAVDPHQLMRGEQFISKLTDDQKIQLLGIFIEFTKDHITKAVNTLITSLNGDQEGTLEMLCETLEAGDTTAVLGLLQMLVDEKQITRSQAAFVEGEIAFVRGCVEVQVNFAELYNLDELMARKFQQKPAPQKKSARNQTVRK